jgi:3-oxoacyl-ACP reductase-like protein
LFPLLHRLVIVAYNFCEPDNETAAIIMASKRVEQIAAHLNYPKGMLHGQVAIITGSGQGIGAECARLFANEGAKVVVADVDGGESVPVYRPSLRLD